MFKFKALIAQKGNYFYGERFVPYKNSEVITEDKEEAEYLRNNRGFQEIFEEVKIEVLEKEIEKTEKPQEKKEISELEKVKDEAIALGLKPHHKAGIEKIQELIKEFNSKEKKELVVNASDIVGEIEEVASSDVPEGAEILDSVEIKDDEKKEEVE